jgi:hypothetical protein
MNICDPRQSIVFEHSPLAYGVYIQRMDITIWNCVLADTLEDMLLTLGSGWCYLLIPTRTLRVDTSMISRKRTRVSEYIGNKLASPFPESQDRQAHGCGEGFSA